MHAPNLSRRLLAVAIVAGLAASACKKEEAVEPDVASLRITVGAQTINVSNNGTVTGGPIVITRPTAPAISATFLNAAGVADQVGNSAEFEFNVTPGNAGVLTFARTAAYTGTLTGVAAGTTSISVSLHHIAENHEDFGPFTVPVTVN